MRRRLFLHFVCFLKENNESKLFLFRQRLSPNNDVLGDEYNAWPICTQAVIGSIPDISIHIWWSNEWPISHCMLQYVSNVGIAQCMVQSIAQYITQSMM